MQRREPAATTSRNRENLTAEKLDESVFSASLQTLWRAWRTEFETCRPKLPQKSAIGMQVLKPILTHVVLTEYQDKDTVIVRLAGTGLEEMANRSLTGLNALDLTPTDQRPMVREAYTNIRAFKCGLFIRERLEFERGSDADLHTLLLPLADPKGDMRFFIGVYDFGASQFAPDSPDRHSTFRHKAFDQISYIDFGFGTPTP